MPSQQSQHVTVQIPQEELKQALNLTWLLRGHWNWNFQPQVLLGSAYSWYLTSCNLSIDIGSLRVDLKYDLDLNASHPKCHRVHTRICGILVENKILCEMLQRDVRQEKAHGISRRYIHWLSWRPTLKKKRRRGWPPRSPWNRLWWTVIVTGLLPEQTGDHASPQEVGLWGSPPPPSSSESALPTPALSESQSEN